MSSREASSEKVLEAKIYVPSETNMPSHRNGQTSQSMKMKILEKSTSRYLELEALGIRTCMDQIHASALFSMSFFP